MRKQSHKYRLSKRKQSHKYRLSKQNKTQPWWDGSVTVKIKDFIFKSSIKYQFLIRPNRYVKLARKRDLWILGWWYLINGKNNLTEATNSEWKITVQTKNKYLDPPNLRRNERIRMFWESGKRSKKLFFVLQIKSDIDRKLIGYPHYQRISIKNYWYKS